MYYFRKSGERCNLSPFFFARLDKLHFNLKQELVGGAFSSIGP